MQPPAPASPALKIWWLAARPKTLLAAVAPVLVGTAVAVHQRAFQAGPALAALLGAVMIQIGTNLANDYYDYQKGADTGSRLGPTRVTQAGLLSPRAVLTGAWLAFGLAGLAGLYLFTRAGWPVILIGLLSIAAGLAYTAGPLPLGYFGLGDVAVFVFFGLVAVGGTYYVQAGRLDALSIWSAVPMGILATEILIVNNLRDIPTDRTAGKQTLAVRIGPFWTRVQFTILLVASYLVPFGMWAAGLLSAWIFLTLASLLTAGRLLLRVWREEGRGLNLALEASGRLELFYALLFSAALLLG
jgi:1,4-dihydroxy-2-naphthoate octaprenyltransferase